MTTAVTARAMTVASADSTAPSDLGGLSGLVLQLIDALGEWGVALMLFVETVFPPIPSEVILPLAGFLAGAGQMNLVLVLVLATLGSYLGALVLYWLGAGSASNAPRGGSASCPSSTRTTSARPPTGSTGTARARCSSVASSRSSAA